MSRSRWWWLLAACLSVGLVSAACGDDGPDLARLQRPGTQDQPRVIEIAMVDIGFQPAAVEVAIGETIEFVFTNDGNLQHEAVFGDEGVQADHEVEMQEMTGVGMGHGGDGEMPMGDGDGMDMDHAGDGEMPMGDGDGMDMDHAGDGEMPMGDGDGMDMDHAGDGEMQMGDGDGHGDEGVVAVSVDPGVAQAVTMTFDEPGALVIGCHVPGHWDAGMRVDIMIAT